MKRGPKPITERFTIEELLGMRGNGMSNSEIAEVVGCSDVTVRRYIGKSGIRRKCKVVNKRPAIFSIDIDDIRKRHENGETMTNIAKDIGCSRALLYIRLKEAKLKVEGEETRETEFPSDMIFLEWKEEIVNLTNDKRGRHYTITNTNGAIDITIQTGRENDIVIDRDEIGELICELRGIQSYIENRWGKE